MKMMIRTTTAVLLAGFLGACGATEPDPATGKSADAETTKAEPAKAAKEEAGRPDHGFKHHEHGFGVEGLIHAALKDPSLSSEQSDKIKALAAELRKAHEGNRGVEQQMRAALAKAVADGKIEDAEIADAKSAMLASVDARAGEMVKALNELHAILNASQRAELVKHVEERMSQMEERFKEHAGKEKEGHWRGRGDHHMAEGLGLDEAQRTALRSAMKSSFEKNKPNPAEFQARREQMKSALAAFAGESFDASTLGIATAMREMMEKGANMRIEHLRTLVSVLRPEQLSKLADRLAKPEHEEPEE